MKKRLLITSVAAAAITLGTSQVATAGTGGFRQFTNVSVAVNAFQWGGQQFHVAFEVDQTNANGLSLVNRSYAWTTHCLGCRTAAISFQVVVAPLGGALNSDNEAHAIEDHCVYCSNLASSYQFILTEPNPTISSSTRRALNQLKRQLQALASSGLTGDALQGAIDQLAAEVEYDLLVGAAQPAPLAKARLAPSDVTPAGAAMPQLTVNRQVQSQ